MTNNTPSQKPESLFPPLLQYDGTPKFLRGEEARLQPLRSLREQPSSSSDNNASLPGISASSENKGGDGEDGDGGEITLCNINPISAKIQNTTESQSGSESFDGIEGQIYVTTKRVLFVAKNEQGVSGDFSIDAQCISLHAMMSEPKSSVYCQLTDECACNDDDDDDDDEELAGPTEIFFCPQIKSTSNDEQQQQQMGMDIDANDNDNDDKRKELCKLLFDSLSKLINLNPVDAGDDGGDFGGLGAMLGMIANSSCDDDNDDDDEMICRIDPSQMVTAWDEKSQEGQGASSDERNRMLERLDNMLVVPPEYEVDGQFDDAEEDDDKIGDEDNDTDIL